MADPKEFTETLAKVGHTHHCCPGLLSGSLVVSLECTHEVMFQWSGVVLKIMRSPSSYVCAWLSSSKTIWQQY